MEEKKEHIPSGDGLSTDMPLGSRIGRVQVAVRPPDPVLIERIGDRLKELKEKGISIPDNSSLAVRSVDGYYYFRSLNTLGSDKGSDIVSIVNYDPVRRTFILSGNGVLDDLCEFFWYTFEAFSTDMMIFHSNSSNEDFRAPDQMDERVSFNISRLQSWRDSDILEDGPHIFWKGIGLDELIGFFIERFG